MPSSEVSSIASTQVDPDSEDEHEYNGPALQPPQRRTVLAVPEGRDAYVPTRDSYRLSEVYVLGEGGELEYDDDPASHRQRQRQPRTSLAVPQGHDAYIPTRDSYMLSEVYVLGEGGELRMLRSLADHQRQRSNETLRNSTDEGVMGRTIVTVIGDGEPAAGDDDDDVGKAVIAVVDEGGSADPDLEKGAVAGGEKGEHPATDDDDDEDETDPNVVWWDGPDDPQNPYNWPFWHKALNIGLISAMTFISPLASSIFAPGVPQVMTEFDSTSLEIATFVVSVYVLGYAAGPVIIAPLSEIYGRVPVYHVCNAGFVGLAVACALAPGLNELIAFRFVCGVFGSAPITNGGGSIADIVPQESRGAVVAVFSIGPLLGPIVGPVAGGFLSDAAGWRWTFWLLAIAGGVISVAELFVLRESFVPVILQRKVARLRRETGNDMLRSKLDVGLSPLDYFKRGIVRPIKMFVFSPVVMLTSFYMAVAYGYLYLMFTTMTDVFQSNYGFSTSTVGLAYLGLGFGSMCGVALFSMNSDKYIKRKAAEADKLAEETGGVKSGMKPEYRLPLLPLGATAIPVGLFIYGWAAEYKVHWIAPIIGTGVVGLGNLIVFMAIQTYLVDAFTIYAASALASNTIVRSIAGAVLPLAGLRMYDVLGLGWGNSTLAFIAIAHIPVSFVIIKYGEYLRNRFTIKNL